MGENDDIVQEFVLEAREMLDDVEPNLIELQKSADQTGAIDEDLINSIFRLFHSFKGGAGFLELPNITSVAHEAETLLDLFRSVEGVLSGRAHRPPLPFDRLLQGYNLTTS